MKINMEKWYMSIRKRISVRNYSGNPDKNEIAYLKELAEYLSCESVRIVVGKKAGIFDPMIGKTIRGTETFAAVITDGSEDSDYAAGSAGEAFILECTSMGLGTCWLGLSYNKSIARSSIKLNDQNERIRCLISIGHYDGEQHKNRNRKIIYNLTGIGAEEYKLLPEWQRSAAEAGRLAPSARNAQPWEFDILEDKIRIACISRNFGYCGIDCGIAMLHIELGAAHCGVYGDWSVKDGMPVFTPNKDQA